MMKTRRALLATASRLLMLVGLLCVGSADESAGPDFYDLKCSACCSIVAELERNLETEKPRMNVDLRRTLGPGGNQGKKIDYAVSELRTLEVLEGVCPGMKEYGVTTQPDGTAAFQRYNVGGGSVHIGKMTLGGDKHRFDQTKVEGYCYELVEEHEEVLSEAIRAAGLAKKAVAEEAARLARLKRKGLSPEDEDGKHAFDPYEVLEIDPPAMSEEDKQDATTKLGGDKKKPALSASDLSRVKKAYRTLSKRFHPDKNGGDTEAVKKFVAVSKAYETLTGEELTPYGDLYRQVCIGMADVCSSEAEVEKMKFFFPRYIDSEKFGQSSGGGLDKAAGKMKEKRKETRKKEREQAGDADPDEGSKKNAKKKKKATKKKSKATERKSDDL